MRLIPTILFAFALVCRAEETAVGRWEGSVQIPERELKVIVDLAQESGGAWTGSIIIPGLDIKGAVLADIAAKESEIAFALKSALGAQRDGPVKFSGHVNADGTLAGDFVQGGNTAPFVLKKIGPPQVELPARNTAVAKELEGEWKGEYELFGYSRKVTITLANHGADGATAQLVAVGKKTNNLPVDLVTQEGDLLTIDSHETGISCEGRWRKDANEIKGTFNQGGIEVPLVLRRSK